MQKKVNFDNLDSLRFLAFLSVFLYHSFYTTSEAILADPVYRAIKGAFLWGNLGVHLFFVLSGFLITYLLLEESSMKGRINVKHFYMRRILRIWPLYFLSVFIGFVGFPLLKAFFGQQPAETADPLLFVTFLGNFNVIFNGAADASILNVLWSVSIEEQFYVFWPLLLFLVPRQHYFAAFSVLITGSLAFTGLYADNYDMAHFHTVSNISDLAVGGVAALLVRDNSGFREWVAGAGKKSIAFAYVSLIVVLLCYTKLDSIPYINVATRFLISVLFAFVILEQNFGRNSMFKLGKIKVFDTLGKYSYGLYCLHFVGILAAVRLSNMLGFSGTLAGVVLFETVLSLLLTVAMSWLSYHFFEKWFLKYKKNYAVITR
jgi:peptidoglycan/LPS O-acetylase OafA/YrhL